MVRNTAANCHSVKLRVIEVCRFGVNEFFSERVSLEAVLSFFMENHFYGASGREFGFPYSDSCRESSDFRNRSLISGASRGAAGR